MIDNLGQDIFFDRIRGFLINNKYMDISSKVFLNIFELDTIEQVYQELIKRRKYGKCN